MNASNARQTRSSVDVYCGLVKTGDLGTSERLRDGEGAWIAISERFVRLAESLADVFPAFESVWPTLHHSPHTPTERSTLLGSSCFGTSGATMRATIRIARAGATYGRDIKS